jgi:AcrR family transcriptional regulator
MAGQTRERIAREALRLFARQGYAGTSIAQIEEASGLKPGAGGLYSHFSSKREVLEAAVATSLATAESAYAMHRALPLGDLRSELTVLARGSLALFDATGDWVRLRAREADNFPKLFAGNADLASRAYTYLADWLRSRVADGVLADHDCDATADILFGAISNYWLREQQQKRRPRIDRERFVSAWVQLAARLTVPA